MEPRARCHGGGGGRAEERELSQRVLRSLEDRWVWFSEAKIMIDDLEREKEAGERREGKKRVGR